MIRLFDTGRGGRTAELCTGWRLLKDEAQVGVREEWFRRFPAGARLASVPGCWNFELDMFHYIGWVWYTCEFEATEEHARLVFGAVNNECDVYVDGERVFTHYGAFMEFGVSLPHLGRGRHTLTLRVGAPHNRADTIPLDMTDWYNYGGIIRPVELHVFESAAILRARLKYILNVAARSAEASVEVDLDSFGETVTGPLTVRLCGKEVSVPVTLTGTEIVTVPLPTLTDLALWDIRQGNLYPLEVSFAGDRLIDRVGFREFRTEGQRLMLNGRPVRLLGANRHEEHPAVGFAPVPSLIKRDLDIAQDLGCNMLRGSHYPNSKITLDYLDEMGILFWEEIPMWGFKRENLGNQLVRARALTMHTEMITRDYNRPSIILWGLENEADSTCEEAVAMLTALRERVLSLDTSRPITYACNNPKGDICFPLADVVSVNVYPVWYGTHFTNWEQGSTADWPYVIDKIAEHMAELGCGDKPLLISEFGIGAIAGDNDYFADCLWTENYQEKIYGEAMPLLLHNARLAGTIVWQFCDMRSSATRRLAVSRPRGYNNKGILDEYRRPKRAYFKVRENYAPALPDGFAPDLK